MPVANPLTDPAPPERSAQLGRRHVGVDPVVVAALRAVGRGAEPAPAARAVQHGRAVARHRGAGENITSVSNAPTADWPTDCPTTKGDLRRSAARARRGLCVRGCGAGAQPISRTDRRTGDTPADRDRARRGPIAVEPGGRGQIDPVAALTWDVPGAGTAPTSPNQTRCGTAGARTPDSTPRTVAYLGTGVLALVAAVTAAIAAHRRKTEAP